jgi:hypothetical protein
MVGVAKDWGRSTQPKGYQASLQEEPFHSLPLTAETKEV